MTAVRVKFYSPLTDLKGWTYLWMKTVRGFNPNVHCARCLIGEYQKPVNPQIPTNTGIKLHHPPGTILYLCGVAKPYRWENNLHLVVRVKEGHQTSIDLYTGDTVKITNAERILFSDVEARKRYPDKSEKFLTCRNFQFGAEQFVDA